MQDSLDFADLMDIAHRNNEDKHISGQVQRYNLEFTKKKNEPSSKVDPRAIQRVLAQKKRDEIRERVEEQRKKERLMAERSHDRKANGRISSMLKRTKSAMKGAVLPEEASAAPMEQLEADDFGYTSCYADRLHASLMKKYEEQPVPDKFTKRRPASNLEATKARMKVAIEEGDDDVAPRRRKPNGLHGSERSDGDSPTKQIEKQEKVNSKRDEELERQRKKYLSKPLPPPLSYAELLAIAAAKKAEPAKAAPVEELPKIPRKEYEFERPMTAKEKAEFMQEREAKLRREGKLPKKPPIQEAAAPKPGPSKVPDIPRIPKKPAAVAPASSPVPSSAPKPGPMSKTKLPSKPEPSKAPVVKKPGEKPQATRQQPPPVAKKPVVESRIEKPKVAPAKVDQRPKPTAAPAKPVQSKSTVTKKDAPEPYVPKKVTEEYVPRRVTEEYVPKKVTGTYVPKPVGKVKPSDAPIYRATKIGSNAGPSSKAPASSGNKVAAKNGGPPSAGRGGPKPGQKRPLPMDPWSRLAAERKAQFAAKKAKPAAARPRIESDSEEEYDSDLEGFIDDGPLEDELDVSQEISKLFGYDRRRYATLDEEDDDDECMESSFGEQLKEEFHSTKAGILEDLKEARLQKMQKMKQKRK